MAIGDTPITLVGNLTADPELRFTQSGAAVANFTVASTPRRFDSQSNQWVDGEAMFLNCNIWRQAAENVAESLSKGMRVVVTGRLRQRSFETREGDKRRVFEVEVDEVGPSLRYATAQVNRNPRQDGPGNGGQGGYGGGNQGGNNYGNQGYGGGQGGYNRPDGNQNRGNQNFNADAPESDPWNSAPPASFGGANDEPPF